MNKVHCLLVVALLAGMVGCGDAGQSSFTNSLRFGTGIEGTGFTLSGEATSFSQADLMGKSLWFRLESSADIDGRFVRLYFDNLTNKDFTAVQATGHITLANFSLTNPGTYQVTGYYVETVIDIGKETLVAEANLTLTP